MRIEKVIKIISNEGDTPLFEANDDYSGQIFNLDRIKFKTLEKVKSLGFEIGEIYYNSLGLCIEIKSPYIKFEDIGEYT